MSKAQVVYIDTMASDAVRKMILEAAEKSDSVTIEVRGPVVSVTDEYLDLSGLVLPSVTLEFSGCKFRNWIDLGETEFRAVRFDGCMLARSTTQWDGRLTPSLDFSRSRLGELELRLKQPVGEGADCPPIFVKAYMAHIRGTATMAFPKYDTADAEPGRGSLARFNFEHAEIEQDMFVYAFCREAIDVAVALPFARVGGRVAIGGRKGQYNHKPPFSAALALNAESALIKDELRISHMGFLALEDTGKAALNLRMARANRFALAVDPTQRVEKGRSVEQTHIKGSSDDLENKPGLVGFEVEQSVLLTADQYASHQRNKFWSYLVNIGVDGGDEVRMQSTRFARSLANGGDQSAADHLLRQARENQIAVEWQEFLSNPWSDSERNGGERFLTLRRLAKIALAIILVAIFSIPHLDFSWPPVKISIIEKLSEGVYAIFQFIFISALFLVILLALARRRINRSVVKFCTLAFRSISYATIRDGLQPLSVIAYMAYLWAAGAIVFYSAMLTGLMAPEEDTVYQAEQRLILIHTMEEVRAGARNGGGQTPNIGAALQAFHKGLAGDPQLFASDALMGGPLLGLYNACRLNWARPGLIDEGEWLKAFSDASGITSTAALENEISNISRVHICERFLPAEYSTFNPLIYAADVVIPLINLRQEDEWSLRVGRPRSDETSAFAAFLVYLEALFVVLGWALALILAGAVTGLSDPTRRPF